MERVTITIEDDLLQEIDALCARRGYTSRSEVFRDIARAELAREARSPDGARRCYGALTYVYDHAIRDLPNRLTNSHHAHHALSVAATHVHMDHGHCLEISILSGTAGELRAFADSVITQRGVRYGYLHIVPLEDDAAHAHPHSHGAEEP